MNFSKNLNLNKSSKPVEQNVNDVSRISQGAAIRGDLSSSTDIRVDGQVDGTLFSEGKVVVAAGISRCHGDKKVSVVFKRADAAMYKNKKHLKDKEAAAKNNP